MSTGFRRTAAHPATDSGRADGVVERTIRSLESGMSVGEVARASNLPRDFIEQIAVFARERGRRNRFMHARSRFDHLCKLPARATCREARPYASGPYRVNCTQCNRPQ